MGDGFAPEKQEQVSATSGSKKMGEVCMGWEEEYRNMGERLISLLAGEQNRNLITGK